MGSSRKLSGPTPGTLKPRYYEAFFVIFMLPMATLYILYSPLIDRYYIGSCLDLKQRLSEHKGGKYLMSYTKKAKDWEVYFNCEGLGYQQARKMERHIKAMKSKIYIENLVKFPAIIIRLQAKYK